MLLRPLSPFTFNNFATLGLLISQSITRTLAPVSANVIAVLKQVVLLPSEAIELVTAITLQPFFANENIILVLNSL